MSPQISRKKNIEDYQQIKQYKGISTINPLKQNTYKFISLFS